MEELNELKTKKFEEVLRYGTKKNRFCSVLNTIDEELELKDKARKMIDKMEKLRRKKEIELENLFIINNEATDLLWKLDTDKKDKEKKLILIEIILEKLKISGKAIKVIRSQLDIHLYQFTIFR